MTNAKDRQRVDCAVVCSATHLDGHLGQAYLGAMRALRSSRFRQRRSIRQATEPLGIAVVFRLAVAGWLAMTMGASSARADDRPFVYAVDAVGPERAAEVDATYALNVGAGTTGAVRFVDPAINQRGVVQQIGAQIGATPWLAFGAFGLVATSQGSQPVGTGGGYAHFTALRPRLRDDGETRGGTFGVTVQGLREFEGVFALSLFVNGGFRRGGFELVANAQFERRFSSTADSIDLLMRSGITYDVLHRTEDSMRIGVEYVGQDLEDAFEEEEAEGGAVHLIAFSTSATLLHRRLHLGLAPGLVVALGTFGFGGRLMVGYTF